MNKTTYKCPCSPEAEMGEADILTHMKEVHGEDLWCKEVSVGLIEWTNDSWTQKIMTPGGNVFFQHSVHER